jgi:hypothetical protein
MCNLIKKQDVGEAATKLVIPDALAQATEPFRTVVDPTGLVGAPRPNVPKK